MPQTEINIVALAEELAPLIGARIDALRNRVLLGDDAVLSPDEAAEVLRKSPSTLEAWRARGVGPRSVKLGPKAVGYRVADLRVFIRDAEATFPTTAAI